MSKFDKQLGVNEVLAGKELLSRPAEEFGNDPTVELLWAKKAFEHAEIYFNLLCSVDPKALRLTPHDDLIYTTFRESFPDMDVKLIIEDEIKSVEGKLKWRDFCEKFKGVVEDYSFGTLVRGDVNEDYSEKNSILVTRIQFYAIEITRNREGLNDGIRNKFKTPLK
ncbi:protein PBDC1 [Cimex lectularius]|uniref:Polysaccharide biosynthesis domain-containing protein n=1 Tax=Cimex lectularius TaxID=79782 RepID=A0A8I6RF46_CIMLE|nr:protein PBDC1 [Cimex lectularius]